MQHIRIVCTVFLAVVTFASAALASGAAEADQLRRAVPDAAMFLDDTASERFTGRIILKFAEDRTVRLRNGQPVALDGQGLDDVPALLARPEVQRVERVFQRDEQTLDRERRVGTGRAGISLPDLNNYFRVVLAEEVDAADARRLLELLNRCACVEIAYPDIEPLDASVVSARPTLLATQPEMNLGDTPDLSDLQGYRFDPPYGVNGVNAHGYIGGRGLGSDIIDVERDWNENHEDLPEFFFFDVPTPRESNNHHGTAVAGEMVSVDNGFGVVGLTPDARIGGSTWIGRGVAAGINSAAGALEIGGIILIEVQTQRSGRTVPMEIDQTVFDAILTATANGLVVVEAAANGSQDLDDPWFNDLFNRDVRDSGAIFCAAGQSDALLAMWFTNYGSRIDVHAWGENVTTTAYGDLWRGSGRDEYYTADFSGTSSASPMATSGAAVLAGIRAQHGLPPLDPLEVRAILNASGTPHEDETKEIGPRVNCAAAVSLLEFHIGLVPLQLLIRTGIHQGGDLPEIFESDDSYLILDGWRRLDRQGRASTEIEVGHRIHPAPLAGMEIIVESASRFHNAQQTIEVFNYSTGSFDAIDVRQIGPTDTVVTVPISSGADQYVDPDTGQIRVEVTNVATVTLIQPWFTTRIDQVRVRVLYD